MLNQTAVRKGLGLLEYCKRVKQEPQKHSLDAWSHPAHHFKNENVCNCSKAPGPSLAINPLPRARCPLPNTKCPLPLCSIPDGILLLACPPPPRASAHPHPLAQRGSGWLNHPRVLNHRQQVHSFLEEWVCRTQSGDCVASHFSRGGAHRSDARRCLSAFLEGRRRKIHACNHA